MLARRRVLKLVPIMQRPWQYNWLERLNGPVAVPGGLTTSQTSMILEQRLKMNESIAKRARDNFMSLADSGVFDEGQPESCRRARQLWQTITNTTLLCVTIFVTSARRIHVECDRSGATRPESDASSLRVLSAASTLHRSRSPATDSLAPSSPLKCLSHVSELSSESVFVLFA